VTLKNAVFWDVKTQFVLTEDILRLRYKTSQLMLCMISRFHGGDYEECHFLRYKNSVRILQETLRLRYRAQPVNAM
jgi:hypothetical protein